MYIKSVAWVSRKMSGGGSDNNRVVFSLNDVRKGLADRVY